MKMLVVDKSSWLLRVGVLLSMFVFAYGAINDPRVFAIFADWRQVALEIDA